MPRQAKPVATLYSRAGCHLCDEAEELLRELARRYGFELTIVDIEANDDLLRRYMVEIPVVALDGVEVAKAPIRRGALEEALAAQLSKD